MVFAATSTSSSTGQVLSAALETVRDIRWGWGGGGGVMLTFLGSVT